MNLNMRLARIKKNLSQAKLAELVGVSRQTILLIEKENFNPSLQLCKSIARELDSTLDELFGDKKKTKHEVSPHD